MDENILKSAVIKYLKNFVFKNVDANFDIKFLDKKNWHSSYEFGKVIIYLDIDIERISKTSSNYDKSFDMAIRSIHSSIFKMRKMFGFNMDRMDIEIQFNWIIPKSVYDEMKSLETELSQEYEQDIQVDIYKSTYDDPQIQLEIGYPDNLFDNYYNDSERYNFELQVSDIIENKYPSLVNLISAGELVFWESND
jgi:hypothetical protein